MVIKIRNFTYRNSIRISSNDFDLAKKRMKSITIRLGDIEVDKSVKYLTDGHRKLYVDFTDIIRGIKFRALTDEHAKLEGFNNISELKTDLSKYYGKIDPEQSFTCIYFRLKDDS